MTAVSMSVNRLLVVSFKLRLLYLYGENAEIAQVI